MAYLSQNDQIESLLFFMNRKNAWSKTNKDVESTLWTDIMIQTYKLLLNFDNPYYMLTIHSCYEEIFLYSNEKHTHFAQNSVGHFWQSNKLHS